MVSCSKISVTKTVGEMYRNILEPLVSEMFVGQTNNRCTFPDNGVSYD